MGIENRSMNQIFWKNKTVLLTGHTGFKGTWLSLILEQLGTFVSGYALAPDSDFYKEISPKMEHDLEGSITDRVKLNQAFEEIKPEIVIHFASHSTLTQSHERTDYIFDTNVMGLVNLLECVRKSDSVKTVLVITSDKCYKNVESLDPYKEDRELGAQDPYSTSKACQELVTECYRNSFFSKEKKIPIATARASNVLGGGDYHLDRLLPSLIDNFIHQRTAVIRKPNAIRPWQNVLDVLGGYLCLIEHMYEKEADSIFCSPFNFGPDEASFLTVKSLAERLTTYFPKAKLDMTKEVKELVKETTTLKISSQKAKEILGWSPRYSIDDTLRMSCEFALRKNKKEAVRDICIEYIMDYFDKCKEH